MSIEKATRTDEAIPKLIVGNYLVWRLLRYCLLDISFGNARALHALRLSQREDEVISKLDKLVQSEVGIASLLFFRLFVW